MLEGRRSHREQGFQKFCCPLRACNFQPHGAIPWLDRQDNWKQGPHTADRTVKAIGEGTLHLVRWLMLKDRLLKHAVRLGEGSCAFRVAVTQMPDDTAADDRGQIDPVCEATAVFLIGQDVCRQRQATLDQHRNQAVLPQRADQAIESHGRDVEDHRAPLQTEAAVGGDQGLPGHIGAHTAIAQDEVRQDGENGFARSALDTPEGEATE